MAQQEESKRIYESAGGSDIHIVFEFPQATKNNPSWIYMGSIITLSYSVYRDKTPVYNLGQVVMDGMSIGKKYVAGSIIKAVMFDDEFEKFIQNTAKASGFDVSRGTSINNLRNASGIETFKEIHTFMKDDLAGFNIHAIFTSEYGTKSRSEIIYGANIINNGQVMSAQDLITETTLSFIGRDVRSGTEIGATVSSLVAASVAPTVSQILDNSYKGGRSALQKGDLYGGTGGRLSGINPANGSNIGDFKPGSGINDNAFTDYTSPEYNREARGKSIADAGR